jgi:prophage regulatory protein
MTARRSTDTPMMMTVAAGRTTLGFILREPSDGAIRFVRYAQLWQVKGISFSRVHINRLEKAGRFPRRVRLGPNTIAWREDELDDWSAARSNERGAPT